MFPVKSVDSMQSAEYGIFSSSLKILDTKLF